MRSALLALLTLLPLVAATSQLVGVSTLPGFLCVDSQRSRCRTPHSRLISQSSLPSLLQHLSSRTTHTDLPLAETSTAPEIVVLVTSRKITDASTLIERISNAVNGASSFQADTDRHASKSDLWGINARQISSVDKLSSMQSEGEAHILQNGISEVLTVSATEEDETLFHALRTLADRTAGKLAVIWTTREDTEDGAGPADAAEDKQDKEPAAADAPTEATEKTMNAPEINSAQLTGLLVALLFLIIFIPGFMCLWNIQPPQSFEIFDSNDVKKKLQ